MIKKMFFILILTVLLISTINVVQVSAADIIGGAHNFISTGEQQEELKTQNINNASETVYNILLILGTVIAVIVGAILGIQFIVGSIEQKGKIKEALIPYVIGCVVVFGAFGIWKLVITILR